MGLTMQQMARRRSGLGASEAAAAVGLNPHCRPIEIWRRKVMPGGDPPAASAAMERGDFLEDGLRRWYEHRSRRRVTQHDTGAHPDDARILATPDGIIEPEQPGGARLLLEIKSPGRWTGREWGEPGSDQVPDQYLIQVTWAMAVWGLQEAHVAALLADDLAIYRVHYDAELFAEVRGQAMEFWERYVATHREPPIDNSDAYARHLAMRYSWRQGVAEPYRAKRDEAAWIRRYQEARHRARALEQEMTQAKNHLKAIMGERGEMDSRYGRVTWRNNRDGEAVDWQAVAREAGAGDDLIARHTRVRPGPRVMNVADIQQEVIDKMATHKRSGK